MYVQYGDMARGKKILEEYLSEPKKKANANLDSIAKIILALVVKCEGNEEKAIEMLQVVKASGYKNISLSLDLITLYLDLNEIDKAKAEWEEVKDQEGQNIALDSCYGRLLLVTGEYQKAYELFSDLVKKPARLVSTFVHCAQCFIHFGQVKEALSALQVASKCVFNHTSPFTKETVEGMYLALKDPKTRIATAKAMDRNIDVIARGGAFTPIENSYPPCDADRLEGFDTLRPKIERKQKAERLPNTEITEEDETYLKTHHIEETK